MKRASERTKFLLSLANHEKVAFVSDVGDVTVNQIAESCGSSRNDSEDEGTPKGFVDFESSGSEYIPSTLPSVSTDQADYLDSWYENSPVTPTQTISVQSNANLKFSSNLSKFKQIWILQKILDIFHVLCPIPIFNSFGDIDVASKYPPNIVIKEGLQENKSHEDFQEDTPHQDNNEPVFETLESGNRNVIYNRTDYFTNKAIDSVVEPNNGALFQTSENFDIVLHTGIDSTNQTLDTTVECPVHTTVVCNQHDDIALPNQKTTKERETICPICFQEVTTHFPRHLLRHHGNSKQVKLLNSLKPRSKERLDMIAALRKQGYFYMKTEKGILKPVRSHYSKKLLYKHVKICKLKPPDTTNPGKNCLSKSQTYMASMTSKNQNFLKSSRIREEVFSIMRPDEISGVAKNDPLICLYGEELLNKHKRKQICTVVSNKIREMARLLIAVKSVDPEVNSLFDALKPEKFQCLILAVKSISGYNTETKSFKAPSLALHMGTNLKIVCDLAFKIVVEKRNIPKVTWTDRQEKKTEIKELKKLIVGHWCTELSSLALKDLKEKQWETPVQLPQTSDIQKFQSYISDLADKSYDRLTSGPPYTAKDYKTLTECVLVLTVMFNRKRIGDVQYLTIANYLQSLTAVEKILIKKFKRVVTGGKGSKPIPILFLTKLQKFISCLIEVRRNSDIVPQSNTYLFANPGSQNRWMSGTNVVRHLGQECGVQNPGLLTSTKFRKHIVTTLQLMSMDETEMDQVATFMGHTRKTHSEFYRLPQDIFQTAKVAKVLLLLEKGKGQEFQGKSLNDIHLEKEMYYSSESEIESDEGEAIPLSERALSRVSMRNILRGNVDPGTSSSMENYEHDEQPNVENIGGLSNETEDNEDISGNVTARVPPASKSKATVKKNNITNQGPVLQSPNNTLVHGYLIACRSIDNIWSCSLDAETETASVKKLYKTHKKTESLQRDMSVRN
ncbi:hypothetical protein NQ315_011649 [Exocentrus adspersus]|uniref:C2H2-type domain-containing protein n=1 Tax=Exocentrus adspersus TaxID=1586481 RepID=A0AAV8VAR2_9CUCU|nr:hypothetical protein NQ315_011649 [Exocentrus adspersus]